MGPFQIIRIILLVIMMLSGIGTIIMVLMQKSNSDGVSALSSKSSSTDTFYGKNKGMRKEWLYKVWTYVFGITLAVASIVFFILS
jgi:protein translocase SecG subunit